MTKKQRKIVNTRKCTRLSHNIPLLPETAGASSTRWSQADFAAFSLFFDKMFSGSLVLPDWQGPPRWCFSATRHIEYLRLQTRPSCCTTTVLCICASCAPASSPCTLQPSLWLCAIQGHMEQRGEWEKIKGGPEDRTGQRRRNGKHEALRPSLWTLTMRARWTSRWMRCPRCASGTQGATKASMSNSRSNRTSFVVFRPGSRCRGVRVSSVPIKISRHDKIYLR